MANIKCSVKTCKYYNDEKCMSYEIDVGKVDAVNKEQTMCETYRKKKHDNYVTEFGMLNSYCNHQVSCDARNCIYNFLCKCQKHNIEINDNNRNKICSSFRLEK